MRKYTILVLAVFLVSYQGKNEKIINSIQVLYYNGIFDRVTAVTCDEIVYTPLEEDALSIEFTSDGRIVPKGAVILDSIITDKEVLQEIAKELRLIKRSKNYGIDARMKCYIKFTNGSIDSLCLAESATYGYYNKKPTIFTNKFAYLIRKNCGFYKWMSVKQMKYFNELNDSTFVREKVKSCWGEEY